MPSRVSLDGNRDPSAILKDRTEAEWAMQLSALLSDQYDALVGELGDNGNSPSPNWWQEQNAYLLSFLGVSLFETAQVSVESVIAEYGIGVDWDAVLNASQDWAQSYGFDLVSGINSSSQQALQKLMSQFHSGAIDYDTMLNMLTSQYGPTRASAIAATEVNRSFEQGIDIYQNELQKLGLTTDRVWLTTEGACAICLPLHGVLESEGGDFDAPPAHPNCFCFTEIVTVPQKIARIRA